MWPAASILNTTLNSVFGNLYSTWTVDTSQVAIYCMQYLNMQHRHNVRAVLTVRILGRMSGECGHHTTGLSLSDVRWMWSQHHWSLSVRCPVNVVTTHTGLCRMSSECGHHTTGLSVGCPVNVVTTPLVSLSDVRWMWSPHHWSLSVGCPVNVVTTPLVSLCRMSATWSYINSTVFGRTSGTEQLHRSKLPCSYFSFTDWQHCYGSYSGVLYTEPDEHSCHATTKISKITSNIIPWILTAFRYSDKNSVGNFHFTKTSHTHQKSHSPKAYWTFHHRSVNFSILPPNIFLGGVS
jgi:hypothetical protein